MMFPTPSRSVALLGLASFGLAVLVGRVSRTDPETSPPTARAFDLGPQAVVIETGSVEHRLRTMEVQLLELRNKLDSLDVSQGWDRATDDTRPTGPDPGIVRAGLEPSGRPGVPRSGRTR